MHKALYGLLLISFSCAAMEKKDEQVVPRTDSTPARVATTTARHADAVVESAIIPKALVASTVVLWIETPCGSARSVKWGPLSPVLRSPVCCAASYGGTDCP